MARMIQHDMPNWWCRWCKDLLALSWLCGLFFGVILFRSVDGLASSLMRKAAESPVSIVSLLTTILLPFLLSAFAVYVSEPRLLLFFSFLKAASFIFVSLCVVHAFHSAGWLIRLMLMFADVCSMPLLYGFWYRHIGGGIRLRMTDMLWMIGTMLICSLDHYCISPFLAELV